MTVARWEWRTFGDSFGPAESRFAALSPERVQESDDLYLLSRNSDASVKVRDEVMDVKRLQRVDDDGLEQWMPVLKAPFPLGTDAFGVLREALGVAVAPPDAASLEELAGELADASPDLLAVMVHKRRARYTTGGCMAEVTEMRTELGTTRTIAVESEDPASVTAAVRELGLQARANVSVARGLKTLAGFGARRYAVIDVGTNSVKFHIGERRADGQWNRVADRAEVTRLGEGLEETGRLGAEPIERTVEAVAGMVEEAHREGAAEIAAVGTAGLRIAPNSADFLDAVR